MSSPETPIIPPPHGIPPPKGLVEPEAHHGSRQGDDHSSPPSTHYKREQMYVIAFIAGIFILGALLAGMLNLRAQNNAREEKRQQEKAQQQAPTAKEPGVTSTKSPTQKTIAEPSRPK